MPSVSCGDSATDQGYPIRLQSQPTAQVCSYGNETRTDLKWGTNGGPHRLTNPTDFLVLAEPGWWPVDVRVDVQHGWLPKDQYLQLVKADVQPANMPWHAFTEPVPLEPNTLATRFQYWYVFHGDVGIPVTIGIVLVVAAGALHAYRLGKSKAEVHIVEFSTLVGRTFDGYTLVDSLGQGAFAEVFLADISERGEKVAVKMLKSEYMGTTSEALSRFHREARVQLVHPNVVQLYGFGEYLGRPYIVMQFIQGTTLRARLTPRLPVAEALSIFMQLCDGLGFAHHKGFVHRDLKPENVMIDDTGVVKIMDFGIAKHLEKPGATRSALTMGTPLYMSPEQVDSSKTDTRSDIYSMGIMLFEMLTGRTPFNGDAMALIVAHMTEVPPTLRDIDPSLPAVLEPIVARMLEKDRDERYATVDEVASAIEQACNTLNVTWPAPT